ncbi:serine/threonine-protein kinase [Streptomyces avidinii]|uniref:Serine/threonine protein kinase n=1 Tax=Streptomyces avidinii TaxID=1895 RepID=A0ABS4LH04_STRAV|nr:serine/threonine-protein kinase [Streptomyces avidinii]MBP2041391.1 serine/threonine protein kinase [Streptomyces avidinii]GGY84913.1 serine/threonine protein kinase [Streptomyces avidinii]
MHNTTEVFEPLRADDPSTVAGYRIAARLGAGGMGRVYLSHTQGGRPVAIKVVRPELAEDPAFRRRFRREVEAARRVRGAYTAELIDADADGTPPWLATLYVPGPSLSQAVARRGPLPVPAVLWLMAGVAEALQAIHAAGIVHRDMKPSNVLLAADGPRVIDFGISLASDTTAHTTTGATIGTPQYMAPEQASAGEVTAAADVFALGQTAAYAALGEPLYGTGPSALVLYRIVHSEPDLTRLPQELRPLIARCLAADPQERATPAEIVAACRQLMGEDLDADSGPALWREVTGPEPTVPEPEPEPVPDPEPTPEPISQEPAPAPAPGLPWTPGRVPAAAAPARAPLSADTMRQVWQPPQRPAPETPEQRRKRRWRNTLVTVTSLLTVTLMLGSGWLVFDRAADRARDAAHAPTGERSPAGAARSAIGTPAPGPTPSAQSPSPSPSPSGGPPKAIPYPMLRLEDDNSIGIQEPVQHADRVGDIRLECGDYECSLVSSTSVITMLRGRPNGSLDSCRTALDGATAKSQSLHLAAAGSEFCLKHPSGDIALFVITIKATSDLSNLPAMVSADMTVWRAA